jgi:lactoylglutathione lyase
VRTLHFGLHVADLDRALAFYTALRYEVVGSVPETGIGPWRRLLGPTDADRSTPEVTVVELRSPRN